MITFWSSGNDDQTVVPLSDVLITFWSADTMFCMIMLTLTECGGFDEAIVGEEGRIRSAEER